MLVTYIPQTTYRHLTLVPSEVELSIEKTDKKQVAKMKKKGDLCSIVFKKDFPNIIQVIVLDNKTKEAVLEFTFNILDTDIEETFSVSIATKKHYACSLADRIKSILKWDLSGDILNISIPVLKLSGFLSDFDLKDIVVNRNFFADQGKAHKTTYDHLTDRDIYRNLADRYSGQGMGELQGKALPTIVGHNPAIDIKAEPVPNIDLLLMSVGIEVDSLESTIADSNNSNNSDRSLANLGSVAKLDNLYQGIPEPEALPQPEPEALPQLEPESKPKPLDQKVARLTRNRTRTK